MIIGVDHDYLCRTVEDSFIFEQTSFSSANKVQLDGSLAQYSGGELRSDKDLKPVTGQLKMMSYSTDFN